MTMRDAWHPITHLNRPSSCQLSHGERSYLLNTTSVLNRLHTADLRALYPYGPDKGILRYLLAKHV